MKKKSLLVLLSVITIISLVVLPASAAPAGSWVTDFTLYNLSGSNAVITIMRYTKFTGSNTDAGVVVKDDTILGNGSYYYNPAADTAFPSGFSGSITVSSSTQLAGTVTVANSYTGKAFASDAYSAVVTPSTTQYLPIVMGKLGAWNTRISIQNAGGSPANITVTYVGSGAPAPDTITGLPSNMTAQLDQYDNAGMTNFNGSAVVTSTNGQPLAVVVEEYRTTGGILVMYNGTGEAAQTVYMPGYINQGVWNTDFTIVNTNTTTAANVTVTFANAGTVSGPIPANGSVYLNNSLPTGWTGTFPDVGYYGAATITSNTNVVMVYNIANTVRGGSGNLGTGYVGFPSTAASQDVIVPLVENLYSTGWSTTYSVQSVDGTPASLSMTYSGNKAAKCSPCTYTMATGESAHTFNQADSTHVPTGFLGGVTIHSDKPIVVIADQNNALAAAYRSGDAAAGFPGIKK